MSEGSQGEETEAHGATGTILTFSSEPNTTLGRKGNLKPNNGKLIKEKTRNGRLRATGCPRRRLT